MIDVSDLTEIFAHLEQHPATAIYGTCPCGVEVNSYTGWIEHAVIPVVTDAIMAGFNAGLTYEAPHDVSAAIGDDVVITETLSPFDLMAADILDAEVDE